MPFLRETPGMRRAILFATWAACTVLLVLHAAAVRDTTEFLDGRGRHGRAAADTPLKQFVPARYADAQMWVRHTLTARETGATRVRFTSVDNAPDGREVHWASGFRWALDGTSRVRQALTGEAPTLALERSLVWVNVSLLLGAIVVMSGWVARRAGGSAGVLVAAGMFALPRFYQTFEPLNADHHGLIAAAVLGVTLGNVFMGGGWWQADGTRAPFLPESPEAARRAAMFSAVCGAFGMWISAASTIPAIAIAGIAGLSAAWFGGRAARDAGAQFAPEAWRIWGRTGAAGSLVFYFVEYAPSHLGWRLEVNNPFYAAAWWGGAELVATLAAWRSGPNAAQAAEVSRRSRMPGLALPVLAASAVLAPLVVIAGGGTAVFTLRDPFVADLRHYVIEGQTLATTLHRIGVRPFAGDGVLLLVVVAAAVMALRVRGTTRVTLLFLVTMCVAWAIMSVGEMRWVMNLATAQVALVVFLFALARQGRGPRWRAGVLAVATLGAVAIGATRVANEHARIEAGRLNDDDGVQLLFRDVAAVLRACQPAGDIVLLASPNASTAIGYYSGARVLGTLYWENAAGLQAAARIFSARTDDEAARLIRARRVTHVAIISTALFLDEYFRLLHPDQPLASARDTFGYRLLTAPASTPPWLQPLPYRFPMELQPFAKVVRLFKVAFDQTEPERLAHTAVTQLANNEVAAAENSFWRALALTPLLDQPALCESAGAAFYGHGADAAAVRWFRRALDFGYHPATATTLAWILASTANPSVRDGRAALALLEPQLSSPPADPSFLSAHAAALADAGRFPEALDVAQRALDLAHAAGDTTSEPLLRKRLESYRARRAWRQ